MTFYYDSSRNKESIPIFGYSYSMNLKERRLHYCNLRSLFDVNIYIYFTLSTIALKASGLFTARSASTLRLISIPALWRAPIKVE